MLDGSELKNIADMPENKFIDHVLEHVEETTAQSDYFSIIENISLYLKNLEKAFDELTQLADKRKISSSGVEWFLDNYFVIQKAIELILDDMPEDYFRKLPGIEAEQSIPRVYSIAKYILIYLDIELVQNDLNEFLNALQEKISLKMSELWALPLMLRLVLVEILTETIFELVEDEDSLLQTQNYDFLSISPDEVIARSLRTLLLFDRMDWKKFFESHAQVEKILRTDPLKTYQGMDFETRDLYRKKVEHFAEHSQLDEIEVAQLACDLANRAEKKHKNQQHVGFYLLDDGEANLRKEIDFQVKFTVRLREALHKHKAVYFLGSIMLVTLVVTLALMITSRVFIPSVWQWVLLGLVSIIPASSVAVNLLNSILTTTLPPHTLPKMDFSKSIPKKFRSVVAIPCLLTNIEELEFLLGQLELHYLSNKDKNIGFVLLTDFGDAPEEKLPDDQVFLKGAIDGINRLNELYRSDDGRRPFFLFHRLRQWNPKEDVWMGWERKRGKLADFNRYLLEGFVESFDTIIGDLDFMEGVRYVITLDSDTDLPRDSAKALIATLAHPLNQAEFQVGTSKVIRGYTILQPRTEVKPTRVIKSYFSRIYAGDLGLDLYTRAVSDVYQDLFGEGIYVGKGIYDVAAFYRSLEGKVPQNSLLSHDLFEGIQGRAGLVSDIVFFEDYPPDYASHVNRLHRWVRGDWQLLPWLFPRVPLEDGSKEPNPLSAIDLWKIIDNLRRSLLAPMTMVALVLGWLFFQEKSWIWALLIVSISTFPLFNNLVTSLSARFLKGAKANLFMNIRMAFLRWVFWLVFLPYESLIMADAIITTLIRIFVSHKRLLQWQTSAHSVRLFGKHRKISTIWGRMITAPLLSLGIGLLVYFLYPAAFWTSFPFIVLWIFSPQVAYWISLRRSYKKLVVISTEDYHELRSIARMTWLFFERFIGPEDHWLPPDHFQEDPKGEVAHRTSPTNIGLMLLSTASAYDFGYIGVFDFVYRMTYSFETLDRLEKYRGHLLNWYDTQSLECLSPRYVSTVDSGNYAMSLIGLNQILKELPEHTICPSNLFLSVADSMGVLAEIVGNIESENLAEEVQTLYRHCRSIEKDLQQSDLDDYHQTVLLEEVREQLLLEMQTLISRISDSDEPIPAQVIQDLRYWSESIFNHLENTNKQIKILAPWLFRWQNRPDFIDEIDDDDFVDIFQNWYQERSLQKPLSDIPDFVDETVKNIKDYLTSDNGLPLGKLDEEQNKTLQSWIGKLIQDLQQAKTNVIELFDQIFGLIQSIDFHLERMEFGFLYDKQREVFFLGYRADSGRMDQNHYDLLASEARTASLYAIAQNQAPRSHWLHMARPFTAISGIPTLISWNGSMFEYLMPNLFTYTYPETLLYQTSIGAVQAQIDYGKEKKVPWGISESGYFMFDRSDNYQYKGFGVPKLGRKRGLANDLVVAPYASLMAVAVDPEAVMGNIAHLRKEGALGHFGFYESIDYTSSRLQIGEEKAIVKSYYVHHQGMIMVSLANYLNKTRIDDRVHRDPRIKTGELLLQEHIPQAEMIQPTRENLVTIEGQEGAAITVVPWTPNLEQPGRSLHTLSNGRMLMLMTDSGSGYLSYKDNALTRWRQDEALDLYGIWYFIQDLDREKAWSVSSRPILAQPKAYRVVYSPHMIEIRQVIDETWMMMQSTIAPNQNACIQKVSINNQSDRVREFRILSYGEVVLAPHAMDRGHPAFNKLFIESTYIDELNLLHFQRRLRSSVEKPQSMAHFLFDALPGKVEYFSDRGQFIGRGFDLSDPVMLSQQTESDGIIGNTLDPIFSLGKRFTLKPNQSVTFTYVTLAADDLSEAKTIAKNLRDKVRIVNAFASAESFNEKLLRALELNSDKLATFQKLLSYVIYPRPQLRAEPDLITKNELGQSGLWPYGISGDHPILLVMVNAKEEIENLQELLLAHNYWRKMGMKIDLVILNTKDEGYAQALHDKINQAINVMDGHVWLNRRGGIFVVSANQIESQSLVLLKAAANVLIDLQDGSLEACLSKTQADNALLPAFVSTNPQQDFVVDEKIQRPENLLFDNGIGGFSKDGQEYQIFLENYPKNPGQPGQVPPAPWANVIANEKFGFIVTESGGGYTWAYNSGENRLTPWTNDPVSDPAGESFYLRDEINGKVWSPTPFPAGDGVDYLVRHGLGYTIFESINQGFKQHLTVFADADQPVKIIELRLTNLTKGHRRITGTYLAEWVLSAHREISMKYIVPSYDGRSGSLMARNPYSAEFSEQVAFLTSDLPVHGLTTDRQEFLGLPGNRRLPGALTRMGLSGKVEAGVDPCAALQVHVNFEPGEEHTLTFILGQGKDIDEAHELAEKYSQSQHNEELFEKMQANWSQHLSAIQVDTPSVEMNLSLNGWMLYQALSSRIWGRTGFYQSSGAYGYRDQLQDVLALLESNPEIARKHILRAARHQFDAGDVLHWWHPPSGRGVRTRITDDLLWLVYVTAEYVQVTGDQSILDEKEPFKKGDPLEKEEEERYSHYETSQETYSIFEHCRRALDRGDTQGPHGLPLIGGGDWNDGMNRVGIGGNGESVWLGWFLYENHKRFANLCEIQGDETQAESHRQRAEQLAEVINEVAWDGEWYLRAYYDDGSPLGTKNAEECMIDSLPQSWSVLTGGAPEDRQKMAMEAVEKYLVSKEDQMIKLFKLPFNKTKRDPGYIKGYPPGIRENGGQYTHAAIWAVWALAKMGQGDKAFEQFSLLNPISHSTDLDEANRYRVEPYVVAADIYSTDPHVRRGGWTWYTGSSSWLYRLGVEAILGFTLRAGELEINPRIPSDWEGFELTYRYHQSTYHIKVKNPDHIQAGVKEVKLDGERLESHKFHWKKIPLNTISK
jgi:cyclic beta-1,2-glucan synthetase